MPPAKRKSTATVRMVRPWKHTERDRGYARRKAAADARLAVHIYDAERCKGGCSKRSGAA